MSSCDQFLNPFVNIVTWTPLNRIWKVKFFVRMSLLIFILYLLCSSIFWLSDVFILYICLVPILFFSLYWFIHLVNKRFHDCWFSWWWQLLLLIPIINFLVLLYLFFAPWDECSNSYWEPSEFAVRENVLAKIFLLFDFLFLIFLSYSILIFMNWH